ncbi:MAG: hypothetical protein CVU74_05250 [Deltaproteobacteria bacterium HGW-Deltaproteobacteria-9]|nr:MAG: hypothetical protein CVU74_05250 [Deltaproteobacteria bacterium HGW-Deltaproteobacteria-9]
MEKITMLAVTICASSFESLKGKGDVKEKQKNPSVIVVKLFQWGNKLFAGIAWLDALIMPRALSAVLLIKARKKQSS